MLTANGAGWFNNNNTEKVDSQAIPFPTYIREVTDLDLSWNPDYPDFGVS
jgi:hypothetical protein